MRRSGDEMESFRRSNKRRRRSTSEEKRVSKKQETASTVTSSEHSQTSTFTSEVQSSNISQENRPPNMTINTTTTAEASILSKLQSPCSSVTESNDIGVSPFTPNRTIPLQEQRADAVVVTAEDNDHLQSINSGRMFEATSTLQQSSLSGRENWSDEGSSLTLADMPDVESTSCSSLCDRLRDCLSLNCEMNDDDQVQLNEFSENDQNGMVDDEWELDNDTDAFADEEWIEPSVYIPAPYNQELDWEE